MVGMGLAALGPEKYIGRCPGHKQVLRSGNPRYTNVQIMTLLRCSPNCNEYAFIVRLKSYSYSLIIWALGQKNTRGITSKAIMCWCLTDKMTRV